MAIKEKILIVDDTPESIWPLIGYLESEYEVFYATTPAKALTLAFSENKPDLILLDIMMPEMDGYQVFEKLKSEPYTSDIPVIFLTALDEHEEEAKGLEVGAQDYIVKPFSMSVVGARIRSVLNLKRELDRRQLLKKQLEQMNEQLEHQVRNKMRELNEARETLYAYEEKYDYLFKTAPEAGEIHTVLIVDDTPSNIHLLMSSLEEEYRILFATSGHKAVDIASSEDKPDVILLDVMMPDMDGYEVCSRLKATAETWDIPVIFITALDQELDETKGLDLGAVDFIVKPFSIPVVKARVKSALRLKEEMDSRVVLTKKLEDLNKNLEQRVQEKTIALKQAHDVLRDSEKRYRTLYETAIEGIFEATPKGRFLSASPSLARMLGYDSPMDLLTSVTDIARQVYVNPDERDLFKKQLEEDDHILNFETRFKKKQGQVIWVMICAKRTTSEFSDQQCYQGFLIDISQQKKAQLKNQQHLRELQLLNKIIAESVLEPKSETILQTACRELVDTFQLPYAGAVLLDRTRSNVQLMAENLSSNNGDSAAEGGGETREVSLADNPSLLQLLTESMPQSLSGETLHREYGSLLSLPDDRSLSTGLSVPIMGNGKTVGALLLAGDGKERFTDDNIWLVKSVADQISGVLTRIQLDEKQKELEKQYHQAQKMQAIGTLTGGIAHDFNNILTVIMSVTELVQRKTDPQSGNYGKLQQVRTAARRATSLVRQLLAFSRQQVLQPKQLDLNNVLRQFEKMLARVIGEDVDLVFSYDPDLGVVVADEGQMEQIFMNLAVNARDAMVQGGKLIIETANIVLDEEYASLHLDITPGPYIMVAVSDNGTGITQEDLPHIFEPFFTTKEKGKGTGLGLASVHGIVKQSGGHITVDSETGRGTCFKIYLPRGEQAAVAVSGEGETDSAGEIGKGTETVLVIEDDALLNDIVSSTLRDHGYTVHTAESSSAAIELFQQHGGKVDMLLTDVIIPGEENGISLAGRFSQQNPQMKVVYMSGYMDNDIIREGILEKGMEILPKPFLTKDLVRKVRRVLDSG